MVKPRLTDAQKAKIVELRGRGMTFGAIARLVKCSRHTAHYWADPAEAEMRRERYQKRVREPRGAGVFNPHKLAIAGITNELNGLFNRARAKRAAIERRQVELMELTVRISDLVDERIELRKKL